MNARISATGASRAFRNHTFSRVARSTHLRGTTALPRLQAAGHGWRSYSTETPQEQDAHTSSSSSPAPTLAATASRATFRERPRTFERSPSSSDEDFPRKGKLDSDLSRGTRPMPTLNPSRIRSTDYVDLSNRIFVYLTKQKPHSRVLTSAIYYRRGEVEDGRPTHADHVPFPAGTRGFFYWTANPRLTALGGEIRFRVTNNPSADSMAVGWDLLGPDGYSPWRLSVLQVLNTPLIEYLVDEHLVSPFDIERYHNTRRGHMAKPLSNSQICVQPGHAFVFDFGVSTKNWESIWILGHYFINWISFGRLVRQSNSPRSGAAMFTVERTNIASGDTDQEAYVIRCQRIFKPLEYDPADARASDILEIIEGELVAVDGKPATWPIRRRPATSHASSESDSPPETETDDESAKSSN